MGMTRHKPLEGSQKCFESLIPGPLGVNVEAMENQSGPQFVVIEATQEASSLALAYGVVVSALVIEHEGVVLLAGPADKAEVLEDGSVPHAVLVFKFPSAEAAENFWADDANQHALDTEFPNGGLLHAISVPGIPEDGLPGEPIPTVANVTVPESSGPKAYMLVQGTVSDPEPIATYMETIIPMIIERGGVYRAWTPPEGPKVLAGAWPPQYVVLSEWPSINEPRDFWYSDTYQNVAIPTRKPASDFTVLLFEAKS